MAEYTRGKIFHPVFGYLGPIPENQLPTKLDLYNHYRMLRNENSKSTRDDIAKELTEVIVRLYNMASIPTLSEIKIKLSIIMHQFGLESRVTRFAQMDLETCFFRYLYCESYRSLTKK